MPTLIGEKQRVAIARSMVIGPDLLLADEPSGSLDEGTGDSVMDLIFSLVSQNNKAMILVTHNKQLAKRCSKVFLLEHGQLKEESN
jgi:putative ABC transport system ATP-binding protein